MDLTVAQYSESELSWLLVILTHTKTGKSNQYITLLKFYRSSFRTIL